MSDLRDDLRVYFDALAVRAETSVAGELVPHAGARGARGRAFLAAAVVVLVVGVLLAIVPGDSTGHDAGSPATPLTTATTPTPTDHPGNDVDASEYAVQVDGPTTVVPTSGGPSLVAVRRDDRICLQLRPFGSAGGPEDCSASARPRWETSVVASTQSLDGQRYIFGVVTRDVGRVTVDTLSPTPLSLGTARPFSSLRFFLQAIPSTGSVVLTTTTSDGTRLDVVNAA